MCTQERAQCAQNVAVEAAVGGADPLAAGRLVLDRDRTQRAAAALVGVRDRLADAVEALVDRRLGQQQLVEERIMIRVELVPGGLAGVAVGLAISAPLLKKLSLKALVML